MLAKKNTRKEEAACYRDVRAPFRANIFIAAGAGSAIKIKFTRRTFRRVVKTSLRLRDIYTGTFLSLLVEAVNCSMYGLALTPKAQKPYP